MHKTKAAPILAHHRARSGYHAGAYRLRQDEAEDKQEEKEENESADAAAAAASAFLESQGIAIDAEAIAGLLNVADYYEAFIYGLLDAVVSDFNAECRGGLTAATKSAFDLLDNANILNPQNVAKLNIATLNFTEATNTVYAYCDVSHLTDQFATLLNFADYEQYLTLVSRTGGTLINVWGEMTNCIARGKEKQNGYDVGYCGGTLGSTLLDTQL